MGTTPRRGRAAYRLSTHITVDGRPSTASARRLRLQMEALANCIAEPLEGRVLLSDASPTIDLFNASPAVFVENQGQWADVPAFPAVLP